MGNSVEKIWVSKKKCEDEEERRGRESIAAKT